MDCILSVANIILNYILGERNCYFIFRETSYCSSCNLNTPPPFQKLKSKSRYIVSIVVMKMCPVQWCVRWGGEIDLNALVEAMKIRIDILEETVINLVTSNKRLEDNCLKHQAKTENQSKQAKECIVDDKSPDRINCNVCAEAFSDKRKLKIHVQTIHRKSFDSKIVNTNLMLGGN